MLSRSRIAEFRVRRFLCVWSVPEDQTYCTMIENLSPLKQKVGYKGAVLTCKCRYVHHLREIQILCQGESLDYIVNYTCTDECVSVLSEK